jgi:hypothetical protein
MEYKKKDIVFIWAKNIREISGSGPLSGAEESGGAQGPRGPNLVSEDLLYVPRSSRGSLGT